MAKGDLDGALADCEHAIRISPRNIQFHNNCGLVRQKKGDLNGALEEYNIAIKLYGNYAHAYRNRASVKMAKKDLDGALADYNRAIRLGLDDAAAYYDRALVETAKGDVDAASADFKRAAKRDPKYARKNPPPAKTAKTAPAGGPKENQTPEPRAKNRETGGNANLPAQNKEHVSSAPSAPDHAASTPRENIAAASVRNAAKPAKENHNKAVADHTQTPALEVATKPVAAPDHGASGNKTNVNVASGKSGPDVELHAETVTTSNPPGPGKPETGVAAGGINISHPAAPPGKVEVPEGVNGSKQKGNASSALAAPYHSPESAMPGVPTTNTGLAGQSKTALTLAPPNHSPTAEPGNLKAGVEGGGATQRNKVSSGSASHQPTTGQEPTTASAYDRRAQFRKVTGDLDGALADYNRAIELDAKDAAAYNGRGNVKKAKHDLDGALADYSRAIELNGGNAVAYYNRAITRQDKGDLDGALTDFGPAIQLDPKNSAAYYSRGIAKAMKGDLDGALADYNRSIQLDPKSAGAYVSRASAFFLERKWEPALKDYDRFFDLSKEGQDYPRLYVWLIDARSGRTEAANKELSGYLQQRGDTADWFSKVAGHLLGKISETELLAAAKSPDKKKESDHLCEAWFYIGMKKLLRGDNHGAQACFNKCLATGRKDYTEYYFARSELKALRK
jgi:tetratricopeptide (TPR) repeat protein